MSRLFRTTADKAKEKYEMIVFAILATLAAPVVSAAVLYANMMSDSPGPLRFKGIMIVSWVAVIVFWFAWWIG